MKAAVIALLILGLLAGAVWIYHSAKAPGQAPEPVDAPVSATLNSTEPPVAAPATESAPAKPTAPTSVRPQSTARAGSTPTSAPVSAGLIAAVTKLDLNQPLSADSINQINRSLAGIKAEGAAAVPAIREYLAQNQDINFADANGVSPVGATSMRAALFDALRQNGGPEARQLMLDTLRTTADPAEVGLLAKYVDESAPGQYREEIVSAAKETLEQLLKTSTSAKETGPLFEALRRYGDNTIVGDLQQALPRWGHYAAIALAGLPDGQGIPTLVEEALNPATRKPAYYLFTLQLLAQSAGQREEAGTGLLQLAQQGELPAQAWTQIAQGLTSAPEYQYGKALKPGSGWHTYGVGGTDETFYSKPLDPERDAAQIQARLTLIDQLLAANSQPEAAKALGQARDTLQRQARIAH